MTLSCVENMKGILSHKLQPSRTLKSIKTTRSLVVIPNFVAMKHVYNFVSKDKQTHNQKTEKSLCNNIVNVKLLVMVNKRIVRFAEFRKCNVLCHKSKKMNLDCTKFHVLLLLQVFSCHCT